MIERVETARPPFRMTQSWLECIRCHHRSDLLAERRFRCPHCGDLYDVLHVYPDSSDLKVRFQNRTGATFNGSPMTRSGVWRFKELIMPDLPDQYILTLGEGNVPILPAGRHLKDWVGGGIDLWLMLEGMTPTGSFKDFGGTVMMSVASAAGVQVVACASTGDTSAMAAAYAAAGGMLCVVLLPAGKVTLVQLIQPLLHGAVVITLPGDFDACMRVMQELVARYDVYPANSLNPTRIEGHQATVFLLAQFFHWTLPDWIAVPVGNGSNASSIGKGMRLLKQLEMVPQTSRILGCQSEAAAPLTRAYQQALSRNPSRSTLAAHWNDCFRAIHVGETTATAARIGDPVSKDKVIREITPSEHPGGMEMTSESDLNDAMMVCGRDGLSVCPQTGIALAGVRNAVRAGTIQPGQRVAVIATATGLKFTDAIAQHIPADAIHQADDCRTETIARMMAL